MCVNVINTHEVVINIASDLISQYKNPLLSPLAVYISLQVVFRKLNSSAAVIEEMTGVRILRVVQKLCAGLDCPLRFCDEVVSLDKTAVSTYSTARLSFVTPRHLRTATCQCEGGLITVSDRCALTVMEIPSLSRSVLAFRWQMSSSEQPVREQPLSRGHGVCGRSQRYCLQLCVSRGQKGQVFW